MEPFIRLEDPHFRNLPSQSETRRYELYMRNFVSMHNEDGKFYSDTDYFRFTPNTQDSLACVFETALAKWVEEHSGPIHRTYRRTITRDENGRIIDDDGDEIETLREICEQLEREARTTMTKVVNDYLERTGGNIGLFPYSGERVLLTLQNSETKEIRSVKLDPFSLYCPDALIYALEETAEVNDPRKKEAVNPKDTLDYRIQKRKKLFKGSAAAAVIAALCLKLTGMLNIDLSFFLINLLSTAVVAPFFFLFLLVRSLLEQREVRERQKYAPSLNNGFETHMVIVGVGVSRKYETYNKARFAQEIKVLYRHHCFMKAWSEATEREIDYLKQLDMQDYYETISPFVINGQSYIRKFRS